MKTPKYAGKLQRQVRCKSGAIGWRCRLRTIYKSFEDFCSFAEVYKIHNRIGFKSIPAAWKANPVIEGSVNPSDLRRVYA